MMALRVSLGRCIHDPTLAGYDEVMTTGTTSPDPSDPTAEPDLDGPPTAPPPLRTATADVLGVDVLLRDYGLMLRLDERRGIIEIRYLPDHDDCAPVGHTDGWAWWARHGADWRSLRERDRARIADRAALTHSIQTGKDSFRPWRMSPADLHDCLLQRATAYPWDAVLDYLGLLPDWDGTPRVETLLHDLLDAAAPGTPDGDLAAWGLRGPMVGAVMRARQPGVHFDAYPVWIGAKGCGKSSLIAALVPDATTMGGELPLDLRDAGRLIEATAGRWVMEMAELDGIGRRSIPALRSMLSASRDEWRLAWARQPERVPRGWVAIGTTNNETCLPRDAGGTWRRLVPVSTPGRGKAAGRQVRHQVDAVRDQLWAEVLARHDAAEPGWTDAAVPDGLIAAAEAAAEAATEDDGTDVLADLAAAEPTGSWPAKNLAADLGVTAVAAAKILARAGWQKRRTAAGVVWSPPPPNLDDAAGGQHDCSSAEAAQR